MSKRLIDKLLDFLYTHDKASISKLFKNRNICELVFNDLVNTYECWEPEYYQSCVKFIKLLDLDSLLAFYSYIINNNLGYIDWMKYVSNDILLKVLQFSANKHCTRDYRHLMQIAEINVDTAMIEKTRKQYIDFELENFDAYGQMLSNYYNFFQTLVKNNLLSLMKMEDIIKMKNNFYIKIPENLGDDFYSAIQNGDYIKLEELFKLISRIEISNLIIDYHFENQPFDVLVDIEEMLRYQKNGIKTIDNKNISLYLQVLNLDRNDVAEVLDLHKKMKLLDIKTMFYDDYRKTLDSQYQDITRSILNEKTIKKYKNPSLTQTYGVPIYYLNGDMFYALVKSLGSHKFSIENGYFKNSADFPSFSLTSNDKLSIFSEFELEKSITLIFSSFNPSQIVFTYPCDVGCDPDYINGERPTHNVNKIYTKEELTNVLPSYNQIIYKNQSIDKDDELNNSLECPKVLGVYVYDEITPKELAFAKKYNLPIVLVNTKSYKKNVYKEIDYASHVDDENCLDYEYDVYTNLDVEEVRRNKVKKLIIT